MSTFLHLNKIQNFFSNFDKKTKDRNSSNFSSNCIKMLNLKKKMCMNRFLIDAFVANLKKEVILKKLCFYKKNHLDKFFENILSFQFWSYILNLKQY